MQRLGTIGLLLLGACFSEAPDAQPGTGTTEGPETDGVASTGSSSNASSGTDGVTSASESTDAGATAGSTTATDDTSGGEPCPAGTLDCPCRPEPEPPCGVGEVCEAGTCAIVPDPPDACLVSHGGGDDPVVFAISRIRADGSIGETTQTQISGAAHVVSEEASGPEMLVACEGFLYAALEGTGEVQPLAQGARDGLIPLDPLVVTDAFSPDRGSLRAIVCADSINRLVTVSGIDRETANSQISVRSLVINPDGSLAEDGETLESPYNTGGDPFESLRAVWEPGGSTLLVLADRPESSPSGDPAIRQFEVVAGGGHSVLGSLGVPLQDRVGGLAVDPRSEYLAIAGAQLLDGTGVGARLDIDKRGSLRNPLSSTTSRTSDAEAWGAAKSLILVEHGVGNVLGVTAGGGHVAIADFASAPPEELAVFDTLGAGNTAVQVAHGGTVLITANDSRITTYDFTQPPEEIGRHELAAAQRLLPSHSSSVLIPCGG